MKNCRKCLLSDDISNISVNDQGLCDYCADEKKDEWETRFNITPEKKSVLKQEFEKLLEDNRNKFSYDCVLALSGGKDSTYLLYYLTVEKKLKVLAVHINTHFENDLALKNIRSLKKKLNFDLKIVDPGEDFFIKFYRELFLNPNKEGYLKTICYVCGPLYIGFTLRVATDNKIPLVVLGMSPNQPENMFFEWGREIVEKKDWTPDIFKSDKFDDKFRNNFWNPLKYPAGTVFPRLTAPLHLMDYNVDNIYLKMEKEKILPKRRLSPLKTNCHLNWPIILLDTKLLGHNPYIMEFASLVRKGHSSKLFFKIAISVINILIRFNIFQNRMLKYLEKKFDIKFNDCPVDKQLIHRDFIDYP